VANHAGTWVGVIQTTERGASVFLENLPNGTKRKLCEAADVDYLASGAKRCGFTKIKSRNERKRKISSLMALLIRDLRKKQKKKKLVDNADDFVYKGANHMNALGTTRCVCVCVCV